MRVLITGASGFVAPFLLDELLAHGHDVILTSRRALPAQLQKKARCLISDLTDVESCRSLVRDAAPEAVVHLAGFAHVGKSWNERPALLEANVTLAHKLCEALAEWGKPVAFLYVSSAMIYGSGRSKDERFTEADVPNPVTPYGWSKLAGEAVVKAFDSESLKVFIVRPFNHMGPGQSTDFVCAALAKRVAEAPERGEIPVGNLSTFRDFTDVRDIVRAYRLIVEKQPAERVFLLGSGKALAISDILTTLIKVSRKSVVPVVDPALTRAADPLSVISNPERAKKILGWSCEIPLETTLADVYRHAQALQSAAK